MAQRSIQINHHLSLPTDSDLEALGQSTTDCPA